MLPRTSISSSLLAGRRQRRLAAAPGEAQITEMPYPSRHQIEETNKIIPGTNKAKKQWSLARVDSERELHHARGARTQVGRGSGGGVEGPSPVTLNLLAALKMGPQSVSESVV